MSDDNDTDEAFAARVEAMNSPVAKELDRLRAENAALRGHIAAISDAVESVQDWSGTRVGNAIDAARKDAP